MLEWTAILIKNDLGLEFARTRGWMKRACYESVKNDATNLTTTAAQIPAPRPKWKLPIHGRRRCRACCLNCAVEKGCPASRLLNIKKTQCKMSCGREREKCATSESAPMTGAHRQHVSFLCERSVHCHRAGSELQGMAESCKEWRRVVTKGQEWQSDVVTKGQAWQSDAKSGGERPSMARNGREGKSHVGAQ